MKNSCQMFSEKCRNATLNSEFMNFFSFCGHSHFNSLLGQLLHARPALRLAQGARGRPYLAHRRHVSRDWQRCWWAPIQRRKMMNWLIHQILTIFSWIFYERGAVLSKKRGKNKSEKSSEFIRIHLIQQFFSNSSKFIKIPIKYSWRTEQRIFYLQIRKNCKRCKGKNC